MNMSSISQGAADVSGFVTNQFNNARSGLASITNAAYTPSESTPNMGGFLESNSIVAKFAFLVTVLILFAVGINLGTSAIGFMFSPSTNPYLVRGLISGTQSVIVSQNPKDDNYIPVLKSSDQNTGLEFTWSVWLLVESANFTSTTSTTKKFHVFNKGNSTYDPTTGQATISNGPGMYIQKSGGGDTAAGVTPSYTADLVVVMDMVNTTATTITSTVKQIPLDKWIHIAVRAQNNVLDTYINGTISKRTALAAVPMQNYYNVYVCQNAGFAGKLSNLRYFSNALTAYDINSLVSTGPSLVSAGNPLDARSNAYYISDNWFVASR